MHCTKCGQVIAPGESFCCECGTPVVKVAPQPAPVVVPVAPVAPAAPVTPVAPVAPVRPVAPVAPAAPAAKPRRSFTISVFLVMLSLIMLVSMLILPTVKLFDDPDDENPSTIGILNGFSLDGEEAEKMAYCSLATFVLINASIIAIPVFSFIGKNLISFIMSLCNGVVLLWYTVTMISGWKDMAPKRAEYSAQLDIGLIFCFACVAVTAVLAIVEFAREKKN